jgi:hypothetical protein
MLKYLFDNGLGSKGFRVNIIYWNLVDLQCSSFDCGFSAQLDSSAFGNHKVAWSQTLMLDSFTGP